MAVIVSFIHLLVFLFVEPLTAFCLCVADDFKKKYQELEALGSGGFGTVFAGIRKSDTLPVSSTLMLIVALN